jgi:tetratricopeptide (TPR) repeat protein
MNDNAGFDKYTALGRKAYPNDPLFILKEAAIYNREKEYEKSVELLRNNINDFSGNTDFITAYSASCELLAIELAKKDKHSLAMETIESALLYSPGNKNLLYTKGRIYEYDNQNDSAFHYQKYYEPSPYEADEHIAKLKGLRNKIAKNRVDYEYMQARFSEQDVITSVASVGYEWLGRSNSFSARLNYSGRNGSLFWNDEEAVGDDDGGTGYQFLLGYTRKINRKWTASLSGGIGCSYFPKYVANISATRYFKNDWFVDAGLGYRYLMDKENLFSYSTAINKIFEPFTLTLGGSLITYDSDLFFNAYTKIKYSPFDDGRTSVVASAGCGTAPELNIIDLYSISSSFSHMNTHVSLGGQYMLTSHLSLGVLGVWNTLYDQKQMEDGTLVTQYRNLYNGYVQIFISF